MDIENADTYAPVKQSFSADSNNTMTSGLPMDPVVKRKKRPNFNHLKTIEVFKGAKGYGFTLCGNAPCFLDCVAKGSNAESAGLVAGQYIMTLNGENVSNWKVDQVISLIMQADGVLRLNVAQDEDDVSPTERHVVRQKPRIKPRNIPNPENNGPTALERATAEILSGEAFHAFFGATLAAEATGAISSSDRSAKNSVSSIPSSLGVNSASVRSSISSLERPGKSTTSVSTAKTQKNQEDIRSSQSSIPARNANQVNGESKSSLKNLNGSDDICSAAESGRFYAVVGYIGSFDIQTQGKPSSAMMPAIHNSVRKLQSEAKIKFVLLLEISDCTIRLINAKNVTVTCIKFDAILSCFASGENKQFFGIVAHSGQVNPSGGDTSCMVLNVDPQICLHSVHLKAAKKFTVACTRITSTLCKEFPSDCCEIVQRIQSKCQKQPENQEALCCRTSCNSDSGILVCKDKTCNLCMNVNAMHSASNSHPVNVHPFNCKQAPKPMNPLISTVAPIPRKSVNPFIPGKAERQLDECSSNSTGRVSMASGSSDTSKHPKPGTSLGKIASWAANFDNLINDAEGVEVFTEFLQKEFAEENIVFYQFCQHYKLISDPVPMLELAWRIYNQHLANGCPHPVNVDNQVLMSVYEKLNNSVVTNGLFDEAQLQIYKLMKFDPYPRFLNSEIYVNCVKSGTVGKTREVKVGNQSMASSDAASDDSNQPDFKKQNNTIRKSILPWKRKTKIAGSEASDSSVKSLEKSKGMSQSTDSLLLSVPSSSAMEGQNQCRVYLPNGCHVVMDCARRETVGSAVASLCNDYNLKMKCLEVVDSDHKPISTGDSIQNFGGREIYLERRVYFRVELPSSQNIGVKSKPNISIKDVFQPLLVKYCLSLNNLVLRLHDSTSPLNLQLAVAVLDSKKVVAETIEQYTLHTLGKENQMADQRYERPSNTRKPQMEPVSIVNQPSRIHKKSAPQLRPQAMVAPSMRMPRPSNEEHHVYSSHHETEGFHHKYETTSISNQTDVNPDSGHLFGLLAKVQGSRLDNQRGIMSVSKLEMPSFLESNFGPPYSHSTPEKWENSEFLHLQSTMIHPKDNGLYRKPPTGKQRRNNHNGDLRRHPMDSHLISNGSSTRPLSKMITPIPGQRDNYYCISDDSAFDINPSQLPSPSSIYPTNAPAPSEVGSPESFSSSYEDQYYDQGIQSRRNFMQRSNSTEWLETTSTFESRASHFNPRYPSGNEASTFSSNRPPSNLHYPSTASNQSWQSNEFQSSPVRDFVEDGLEANEEQNQPKVYHV